MILLSVLFFFMRALYFAPFGEMGLPPRFSGSVIAVAAFMIYLPSSFAYLLWGFILDSYPGTLGYALMFGILGVGITALRLLIVYTAASSAAPPNASARASVHWILSLV